MPKLSTTLGRDLHAVYLYLKAAKFVKKCHSENLTVTDHFREIVKKHKSTVCFVFEDEEWTYQRVDHFSNKIAHCFLSRGYRKGDEVALFLENCPEYVCIWLGLAKIGVVTAFINTNLRLECLAHSINVIDTKAVIFGGNLADAVKEAIPFIRGKDEIEYFLYSEKGGASISSPVQSLNTLLMKCPKSPIDPTEFQINYHDKLLYIYTSGTTGSPKAAIFRHSRLLFMASAIRNVCRVNKFETFYNTLPMYHTAGGILLVSIVLCFGGTMVIKRKFSASKFWSDAVKYKITVSQYIGEICRYLLNTPKTPEETQHNIKLMIGNGLRPNIWNEFQERFNISRIVELYGSTEGNATLINMFGKPGAVGFIPQLLSSKWNVHLIKVDEENGQPLRDSKGICIPCKRGEPGEMVAKIITDNPLRAFDGYADEEETQKKIITDCFEKGDKAFLSGDMMVMDKEGYLYFVDRLGDTFRWHGENVSTHQVETVISKILGYAPCVVYGVEIPNTDGRAGMAALQIDKETLDMKDLYQKLAKQLPAYAVPIFVRICCDMESTGTYKLKKTTLLRESYDPQICENLYFVDHKKKTYLPLTKNIYSTILNGEIRL